MKLTIMILSPLIAGLLLTACTSQEGNGGNAGSDSLSTGQQKNIFTCPMHPSVVSDRPGACPVCGMALVKKSAAQHATATELAALTTVSLSPTQRVIANVSTTVAMRQDIGKNISAVGVVDIAEPLRAVASARFRGRIEKLYVDYTGEQVRKGDPLFELHSPELVSAEQELILALRGFAQSGGDDGRRLIEAARERLETHYGLTQEQIDHIEGSSEASSMAVFTSPISGTVMSKQVQEGQYVEEGQVLYELADLSKLWVYLDVYEKDVRFIRIGHQVKISSEAYPDEQFTGKVTFIDPVVDNESRTVRVRTEFVNSAGKLKPQMYVRAQIHVPSSHALAIPSSSIMYMGKRNVVWVEVKPNTFEPRDVRIGINSGSQVEVIGGLKAGETVVTSGGFLIESESQLQSPAPGGGHQHGGSGDGKSGTKKIDGDRKNSNAFEITVDGSYVPDVVHAKQGGAITLTFNRKDDSACTDEVVFETLQIRRKLPGYKKTTVELGSLAPGEYQFSCGMDMVHGTLIVH